ncbi:MAG: TonB-dependent receptor [Cytophagaceae bacterium]|nr:TonB-dependent receptor [Cytophagaceae bacterium]
MIRFLYSFILFSFATIACAQGTQILRGTVSELESGVTLPGVVVAVTSVTPVRSTTTDINGAFLINQIPIGRHTVVIRSIGYHDKVIEEVLLVQGKETVLQIVLEPKIETTEAVVITAEGGKQEPLNDMAMTSARQFTVEETNRYAGSLNDPSRMAANYAGVSGANDGRNDIIIRGNSPLGLLWRIDGLPIPNPNHFGASGSTGGPVTMLNNNQLANSDFFTGAFPAEYGNALSGAFDLNLRYGNNRKREYLGQIGFNGFEFGMEGPMGKQVKNDSVLQSNKASYLFNYRYSTLGFFQLIGLQFGTGAAVPQYQDASLRLHIPTKKHGTFNVFAIGGLSYIELLDSKKDTTKNQTDLYGNGGYDIYFRSNTGMMGVTHKYYYNNKIYHTIGLSLSGQYNAIINDSLNAADRSIVLDNFEGTRREGRQTVTLQLHQKFSARSHLHYGVYLTRIGFNIQDQLYDYSINQWYNIRSGNGSAIISEGFIQWKYKLSDRWSTYAGVHAQQLSLNQQVVAEPRVGTQYKLGKKQTLSASAGWHSQTQPILVYFTQTRLADGSFQETNKDLNFTRAFHLVGGYQVMAGKYTRIKAEAYYQYLFDVPVEQRSSSFSLLNAGADFVIPLNDSLVNTGKGRNYGIECTVERYLHNGFYGLSTLSLFQSKYTGSNGEEYNTAFNGNFVWNVLAGKEFKLNSRSVLALDIKTTLAGGRRYNPIDVAATQAAGTIEYDLSRPFERQYDNYFRTDIKVEYRRASKSGTFTQAFSINVQNVTNHKNIFAQTYDFSTQQVINTYQLGFMPIPQYKILF